MKLSDCGDVLTVSELAAVLHVGVRQARQLLGRGDVFSRRVGRSIRIPKAAVERFLTDPQNDDQPARLAVVGTSRKKEIAAGADSVAIPSEVHLVRATPAEA